MDYYPENYYQRMEIDEDLGKTIDNSRPVEPQSYSEILRQKFHAKLTELLTDKSTESDQLQAKTNALNNVWCLNQIIIPIHSNATSNSSCGQMKLKYGKPESDFSVYASVLANKPKSAESAHALKELRADCGAEANFSAGILNNTDVDAESNETKVVFVKKTHINALFATNHLGQPTIPLVIYPKNEIQSSDCTAPIFQTVVIEETSNGDLNNLPVFFKWLKLWYRPQSPESTPTILLVSSFLYKLLFKSTNTLVATSALKKEIADFCAENRIFILFYPVESAADSFNKSIYTSFRDTWNKVCMQYAIKCQNPHTLLAFMYIFKQVVRKITTYPSLTEQLNNPLRECFSDLFKNYQIPCEEFASGLEATLSTLFNTAVCNGTVKLSGTIPNYYANANDNNENVDKQKYKKKQNQGTDSDVGETQTGTKIRNASDSNDETNEESYAGTVSIPKPSEAELAELIEWINEMSKIGCLCLKHTYLRELYAKYRTGTKSSTTEKLASEKRWMDVVVKSSSRVHARACGVNENDYLLRWFDEDYWRMEYYNFMRQQSPELSAEDIWTFDVIQFPYNTGTNMLRAPEKDYDRRPRNSKPRISVIFAFNAAGDHIQPYFVYPLNFGVNDSTATETTTATEEVQSDTTENNTGAENTTKQDSASTNSENEYLAPNGYITCRVFEEWLTKCFMPYLKQLEADKAKRNGIETPIQSGNHVLMFCGKLAVIDASNLKLCRESQVNLFSMTHENQMPFNLLFQKSLRNRQTDLFLDSWRKVTTKLNLGYQMKCKSRQHFFNLFMDAFQNCIEEIGNSSSQSQQVAAGSGKEELKEADEGDAVSPNQSFSNQSVLEFRRKMASTFQQCMLWPINEEEYAEFLTKGKAILDKCKSNNRVNIIIPEESEIESEDKLLKENNNLLNKEDDGTKPVRGKRGRKSASEASENINSMKVQINTSDCDMTADELTADETMNDETLDSDFEVEQLKEEEDSQNSEDEEFTAASKNQNKRLRKSNGTKANKRTKLAEKSLTEAEKTPVEKNTRKSKGQTSEDTKRLDLESSFKKIFNGKIKDFNTASTRINELVSQNKEQMLNELVKDLLNVFLVKEPKPESTTLERKKKNVSWLNDPFRPRINGKIEAIAATAKSSNFFLETLFEDISNDISCLAAADKSDKKSTYMNDLSSSLCSFYLSRSHEKLKE